MLFSCCPHPLEELVGFCTLFQLPPLSLCHPLPVFLYWVPFADAYLLPFAVSPTAALLYLPDAP